MKLKMHTWFLLAFAVFVLIMRIMNQTTDVASGYFGMTLIVIASGFELVRRELEEIRRSVDIKAEGRQVSESIKSQYPESSTKV